METKFKVQLGAANDLNELSSAIANGITYEFVADTVRNILREYHKETDLSTLVDEYTELVTKAYEGTYVSFDNWSFYKAQCLSEMLSFVKKIDSYLVEKEKITSEQVVSDMQKKMFDFLMGFNSVKITLDMIDTSEFEIKEDYIKTTLDQLDIVNESKILSTLISMDLDVNPIDVQKNKNNIVESKIQNINKIVETCEQVFANDAEKLNDQVLNAYDKFYNICYDSLTDGEKAEKARRVIKFINSHRQMLDKLESKLTEANELSRQLVLNKKRLEEGLKTKNESAEQRIEEDPYQKDMVEFELDSAIYVTNKYISQIEETSKKLNDLKEKISEHYNVLDKLEIALKTAIPSEEEMNKYSSIGLKLQELSVRLELSKSQVTKDNKELKTLIDTANTGLSTMIAYSLDVKDLFMRNSMMSASFKAVNALYNFVNGMDKSMELSQIKFITDKISEYTDTYNAFANELVEYRRIGNNTIRDLSIIMGKPFGGTGLLEIINAIGIGLKQFENLYNSLNANNDKQSDILNAILTL